MKWGISMLLYRTNSERKRVTRHKVKPPTNPAFRSQYWIPDIGTTVNDHKGWNDASPLAGFPFSSLRPTHHCICFFSKSLPLSWCCEYYFVTSTVSQKSRRWNERFSRWPLSCIGGRNWFLFHWNTRNARTPQRSCRRVWELVPRFSLFLHRESEKNGIELSSRNAGEWTNTFEMITWIKKFPTRLKR
jgi:hypothetical protein